MSYYSSRRKKRSRGRRREYIPAHAQRGLFDTNWWGQRWVEAIEKDGDAARLYRARAYAQAGHVQALHFEGPLVTAAVQGSAARPYIVEVRLSEQFSEEQIEDFADAMSGHLDLTARLFSGDMPMDVDWFFSDQEVPLFPVDCEDLDVECNCEDEYQVCKHADAVGYLLGTAIDRDPLLLLELRGLNRDRLLEAIVAASHPSNRELAPPGGSPAGGAATELAAPLVGADAEAALGSFWNGGPATHDTVPMAVPLAGTGSPLESLPAMAFWRSRQSMAAALAPIYQTAAQYSLGLLVKRPAGE